MVCMVSGVLKNLSGEVLPNTEVVFTRRGGVVAQEGAVVVPYTQSALSDGSGVLAVSLFAGEYDAHVDGCFAFRVGVPEADTASFPDLIGQYPDVSPSVLFQAIAARDAAIAAADRAEAAAAALESAAYQTRTEFETVSGQVDYGPLANVPALDRLLVYRNGQLLKASDYSVVMISSLPYLRLGYTPLHAVDAPELITYIFTSAAAYDPNLNKMENLGTRAALVAHIALYGALSEQVYSDGARLYRTIPAVHSLFGTNPIPDLPGLMWFDVRTPFHFGWVGDGTEADMKRGNIALTFAGETVLDEPGVYSCANSHPITDVEATGNESVSNWWAVRRCWYIGRDNVIFRIGPGVTLTLADGADAHMIAVGQFPLPVKNAGGTTLQTLAHVKPQRCSVIGFGSFIDMNAAGQTEATADDYHPAGAWVQNGANYTRIEGLRIDDSSYYGIGLESYNDPGDVEDGFISCYVGHCYISNTLADGIDKKGFGANSGGILIEHNVFENCGSSAIFGSSQAAIDVRDGAIVRNNRIIYTDGSTNSRVGIRAQYSDLFEESQSPTRIIDNEILGNGSGTTTQPIRVSGPNVTTRGNMMRDCAAGLYVTSPRFSSSQDQVYNCGEGLRLDQDTAAGWAADDADIVSLEVSNCTIGMRFDYCQRPTLTGCKVIGGGTGWRVAADVLGVPVANNINIRSGSNTATTRITRVGTSTGKLLIDDVVGYVTQTGILGSIPVGSTGVKTVTVAHGLSFTPAISEITVTTQEGTGGVDDYVLSMPPYVVSVDATNVTIKTSVTTASATGGAIIFARVTINGFQR